MDLLDVPDADFLDLLPAVKIKMATATQVCDSKRLTG